MDDGSGSGRGSPVSASLSAPELKYFQDFDLKECDTNKLKKLYRAMAKDYPPDVNGPGSEEKFKEFGAEYGRLEAWCMNQLANRRQS